MRSIRPAAFRVLGIASILGIGACGNMDLAGPVKNNLGRDGINFTASAMTSAWLSYPSPTINNLYSVWSNYPSDAWAVGEAGTILHWDGTVWQSVISNTTNCLTDVWGSGSNDVWAIGGESSNSIMHWDGTSWQAIDIGQDQWGMMHGIRGTGPNNVWIFFDEYSSWTGMEKSGLIHFDGSTWTRIALPDWFSNIIDVRASKEGKILASVIQIDNCTCMGTWWSCDDTYGIAAWDGTSWTSIDEVDHDIKRTDAIWESSSNDIWAVGWGIFHYDSINGWVEADVNVNINLNLRNVWGSNSLAAWAVGEQGAIYRWNGSSWAQEFSGTGAMLIGIHGSSSSDVWAVGEAGTILRYGP